MIGRSPRGLPLRLLCLVSLAYLFPALAAEQQFTGKVVGVTDGDTISVMHDGKAETIRLDGIDCPEDSQAYGQRAKQFTSALCFGDQVTVKVIEPDKYGRTVGVVVLADRRVVNQELLKAGFAWWYREYSKDEALGKLEAEARAAKRGLWADPNPVPPWEFRHKPKAETKAPDADTRKADALQAQEPKRGEPAKNTVVYIIKTGKKYHADGCRYLSKSKIPVSLKEAKDRGYTPCSVCAPPQ